MKVIRRSGSRRQFKALIRKGVGSNPTFTSFSYSPPSHFHRQVAFLPINDTQHTFDGHSIAFDGTARIPLSSLPLPTSLKSLHKKALP